MLCEKNYIAKKEALRVDGTLFATVSQVASIVVPFTLMIFVTTLIFNGNFIAEYIKPISLCGSIIQS